MEGEKGQCVRSESCVCVKVETWCRSMCVCVCLCKDWDFWVGGVEKLGFGYRGIDRVCVGRDRYMCVKIQVCCVYGDSGGGVEGGMVWICFCVYKFGFGCVCLRVQIFSPQ